MNFGLEQQLNGIPHTVRTLKTVVLRVDLNCGGLAQGVSEKNVNMRPSDYSYDILVEEYGCFLLWAKLKSFGLTALAEEIEK